MSSRFFNLVVTVCLLAVLLSNPRTAILFLMFMTILGIFMAVVALYYVFYVCNLQDALEEYKNITTMAYKNVTTTQDEYVISAESKYQLPEIKHD